MDSKISLKRIKYSYCFYALLNLFCETVSDPSVADLAANNINGLNPLDVQFADQSSVNISILDFDNNGI
ncbi:MAG: hypothetical protein Q8M06_00810, partial [Methanobacteriaceae archaeon]|nr:hypothetical protein [Methanobacteriaceae archaeon]